MPSKPHVSRAQIDAFTSVIRIPPGRLLSPIFLEEQHQAIPKLDPSLLRPRNLAFRIMERFSHDRAVLCPHHRKLNASIVRTLFEYIQREVSYRMMPFIQHPTAPQDAGIREWRKRMVGINSLWMERETFYHIYNAEEGDPVHRQIKNNCEACILATIGGDQQMLTDLYISVRGRGNEEKRSKPAIYMVEGWLDALGILDGVHEACKDFWRFVRAERSRMQRERRARRRAKNAGRPISGPERPATAPERPRRPSQNEPAQVVAWDENEAEEERAEIIDFYARRLSVMPGNKEIGVHRNDSRMSLHPAIRARIGHNAETGKYARQEPELPPMPEIPSGHTGTLGRSNTAISRDSRLDPDAWQHYRSSSPVSPVSPVSADSTPPSITLTPPSSSPPRRPSNSRAKTEYSESAYSRATDDRDDLDDSGYYDSTSLLSDHDRRHDQNLRRNPTHADVGSGRMASNVARNRKEAYGDLVGMPSAYEFEALASEFEAFAIAPKKNPKKGGMKTLYAFEPETDEDESEADHGKSRLENRPRSRDVWSRSTG